MLAMTKTKLTNGRETPQPRSPMSAQNYYQAIGKTLLGGVGGSRLSRYSLLPLFDISISPAGSVLAAIALR